jgi:hypothetical protein
MVVVLPRRSGAHIPAKGSRFVVGKIERYMFQKFRDDNPFGVLVASRQPALRRSSAPRDCQCELFGCHAVDDRVLDLKPMRETGDGVGPWEHASLCHADSVGRVCCNVLGQCLFGMWS